MRRGQYPVRPLFLILLITCFIASAHAGGSPVSGKIIINDVALSPDEVIALDQLFRTTIPSGNYWYDSVCGAWGYIGGPTMGFTRAALPVAGALRPDVSGGGTGVFINGREIHPKDLMALQQCTPVYPGRYWLNDQGYAGYEGGPPLLNLFQLCGNNGGSSKVTLLNYGSVIAGDGIIGFIDSEGRSFSSGQ